MNSHTASDWTLNSPLDMHLHLRQGAMLKAITPSSSRFFSGAVIMPNLVPPITSLAMVRSYRNEILHAAGDDDFLPLMTLFFRDYSRSELEEVKDHIAGIKLYPEGITTNSSTGVRDLMAYRHVLKNMEELGIPLLVHGETHGFVMDREREFMATYRLLAENYPNLKIVMEHISTCDAIPLLEQYENIYATVTLHHLLYTLDDMAGGLLNPHLFCKPLIKFPGDRDAIQSAVLNGNKKIMFGSDSAPHPVHNKECCGCAAGVFSAPVAIPMLADFFDHHRRRSLLQEFVSDNARGCYRINPPVKEIKLLRKSWHVPAKIGDVVPLNAGVELPWKAELVLK